MTTFLLALLTLKVYPSICLAPCTVRVTVKVERKVDNRWLLIQMDGQDLFRSTTIQLNGDQAPITQQPLEVQNVPAGEYEVLAVLYNTVGEVERKRTVLQVVGADNLQQMRKRRKP